MGTTEERSSSFDGVGLQFKETMAGFLGVGEADPRQGAVLGQSRNATLRFDVQINIRDLGRFLRVPEHDAELSGTVTFGPLGGTFPIREGRFNLFTVDARTGAGQMTYAFCFTAGNGQTCYLHGHKNIHHDPGMLDVIPDMTTLFTVLHCGANGEAPVYGTGELRFDLKDAPALVKSMKVEGTTSLAKNVAAYTAFASFAYGALRDQYLKDVSPIYDTRYENLVLSGCLQATNGAAVPFFLVSGVHDRGFPWGDGELFWDILLVIGDGHGGYQRYCMTDRVLEGLELDVAGGVYRYRGPLFSLANGYAASFSRMRAGSPGLTAVQAEFEIGFDAIPFDAVAVSFPLVPKLVQRLSSAMAKQLRYLLPGENPLGIYITPHAVTVRSGSLRLRKEGAQAGGTTQDLKIVVAQTFGEAERGTMRNIKTPTMLYGYLCAIRPGERATRVQIHSGTLLQEREKWVKDQLEAHLGSVVSRMSSCEMSMEGGTLRVRPIAPAGTPDDRAPLLRKTGEPLVEVNNDHFPTAVFQRRIVEVLDPTGLRCLALEEDMSLMRLEAAGTDRKVTVASIRGEDKFATMDRVLEDTSFDSLLEAKLKSSGKARAGFAIVIKPNFMFAYDKRDRSTFTDPGLVHHLVKRLRGSGFENIKVVEAQSTYGEYFDKRSVREMAEYLGYDGSAGYEVVDMTLDVDEKRNLGPNLGEHPVSRSWREADFRISFAKNKTHAYAYYTLTLKNIYGALPLANKFKEYHCNRGIYGTTIEYLAAFPVDYGLVDGILSADGPFGIFADPLPNETNTIIGGGDLVAVDWVAASKMGIDPMISPYMKLAVQAFGKPEISLHGDSNPYRPWLNVPLALALFTNKAVDADYNFGNLMYSAGAQMDEAHFTHKNRALYMQLLRKATVPLRRAFFVRTGEDPSAANRFFSWLFYKMGF